MNEIPNCKREYPAGLRVIARRLSSQRFRNWLVQHFHIHLNNPLAGAIFTLKGCVYKTAGLSFIIPRQLTTLGFRSRFYYDIYEEPERALIKKHILEDDVVLELGGCIGIVSVVTNIQLRDRAKHVVVEPNPELIPWISLNRDRNGARFTIEHCLVGKGGTTADFFIHPLIVGGSVDRATERKTQVVVRDIAELSERYGEFSVIVMDIEGGETRLVIENIDRLRNMRLLLIEEHPAITGEKGLEAMHEALEGAGFQLIDRIQQSVVWAKSP
jgi:FkbM family methyltransferase